MNLDKLAMKTKDYCEKRKSYPYPPAELRSALPNDPVDLEISNGLHLAKHGPSVDQWKSAAYKEEQSSWKLDETHRALLNSDCPKKMLIGILSVVYWGNYADRDGGINHFALQRANWVVNGKKRKDGVSAPLTLKEIVGNFDNARKYLRQSEFAHALHEAVKIKFIRMPFASKLLAFTAPNKAAVYDSVISDYLMQSKNPILREMGVPVTRTGKRQLEAYHKWCFFCQSEAKLLNESGAYWKDWNGEEHEWRAIDVERAHFALAAECNPSKKGNKKR